MKKAILAMAFCAMAAHAHAVTPQATVVVGNSFFNPGTTNINAGDTVEWNNTAGFHNAVADAGEFNSGGVSSGWTFQHTFNTPGSFLYYCSAHGGAGGLGMSGVVNVAAANTSTPTPSPSQTPSFTVSPSSTATPSASPSDTPSRTRTDTPSFTQTATSSATPTISETWTPVPLGSSDTPTPSISPTSTWTATSTPSRTGTATPSASPTLSSTPSATPLDTATLTRSPTSTPTDQPTPPIQFRQARAALAPVPAMAGDPVCLYLDAEPESTHWSVYNLSGDRVARLSFGNEAGQCWNSGQASPGIYFVRVEAMMKDGSRRELKQKIAIIKK